MKKVFGAVAKAGADRIDIPDTVGYSTPAYMAEITKDAIAVTKLPVSVHCHNDFGLAVANAISGIEAGAQCAHVTINGIGERAGNTSLEELVMALQSLQFGKKYETNMEAHNVASTKKWIMSKNAREGVKYDIGVHLLNNLEVERELTLRDHVFNCGTEGEVVDELVVKFKFPKGFDIQPHDGFAENSVDFMIESLKDSEIAPWAEHCCDEE